MKIQFYKYHGAGNDFVIINNINNEIVLDANKISFLCNRRLGIGADGLILLEDSVNNDFSMKFYNSDGEIGTMCGNGGRCVVALAKKLGIIDKYTSFNAPDGVHTAEIISTSDSDSIIKLKMSDVLSVVNNDSDFFIDTGSPHYIKFVDDVSTTDVYNIGKQIRNDYCLEGTNVDFVEIRKESLFVRTFERGVEDETLSCGTGVTASALAFAEKSFIPEGNINIYTKGGALSVCFKKDKAGYKDIWLQGPTKCVFNGIIDV